MSIREMKWLVRSQNNSSSLCNDPKSSYNNQNGDGKVSQTDSRPINSPIERKDSLMHKQKFSSEKKQKYLGKPIATIWFDIMSTNIEEIKEEDPRK